MVTFKELLEPACENDKVTFSFHDVLDLEWKRYFRQSDFPFPVKFDQTIQLCRILRDGVLRVVVHRAVGRQRRVKYTHFETSSSTHESNLLG